MKKFIVIASVSLISVGNIVSAVAQGLTVVHPLTGYTCMNLTSAFDSIMVQSQLPPVLAAPSSSAKRIGYPTGDVFVKVPVHSVNGYVQTVLLNGRPGWIALKVLRPFTLPNGRPGKCIPSVMSNGLLGADVSPAG